jgi:hypothetical protein
MPTAWISLLLAVVLVLLVVVYALRRHHTAAADAAYIDDLERLAQARSDDFTLLARLSTDLGSVLDAESLKRTIDEELPRLTGTDDFWVVARLGGWTLVAGEPAEPGSVVPRNLTAKPEAWECFPLNAAGRSVGLLGTRQPPGGFNDDQRRMLTTVATLLAGRSRTFNCSTACASSA